VGTSNTEKLVLSIRELNCPNYGIHHVREWNVANNIDESKRNFYDIKGIGN